MKNRPHLWVFNQHYPPDALATGVVLEALCRALGRRGWDVRVLAGRPYLLPPGEIWTPQSEERRDGVAVTRLHTYNGRAGTVERLLHYGSYFAAAALRWTARQRPDAALVMSTPPVLVGLLGVLGRALRGVPFVYNVQDLFPDILATSRYAGTTLARLATLGSRLVERRAAAIVPIGEEIAARLVARGLPREKVHVIPNAVDVENVRPLAPADNAWRRELRLPPGAFVVLYAGNMGHAQALGSVLDAAARARVELPDAVFVLVGEGDAKEALATRVANESLTNVRLLPFAPAARLREVLTAGDVGLVPLRAGMSEYLVPSKAFAYMAAGTPVLAAIEADAALARLVAGNQVGLVVAPEDPTALLSALRRLFVAPEERAAMGLRGRELAVSSYSPDAVAAAYDALLRRLAMFSPH